jgi:opacity protein-like surface antigen
MGAIMDFSSTDRTALYALVGVGLTAGGAFLGSQWSAKSAFDGQMVQIGVSILSADPKADVAPARDWAIRLVEGHSGEKFTSAERDSLLHHPLLKVGYGIRTLNCADFRKNPDGTWTNLSNGETPDDLESRFLGLLCSDERLHFQNR